MPLNKEINQISDETWYIWWHLALTIYPGWSQWKQITPATITHIYIYFSPFSFFVFKPFSSFKFLYIFAIVFGLSIFPKNDVSSTNFLIICCSILVS